MSCASRASVNLSEITSMARTSLPPKILPGAKRYTEHCWCAVLGIGCRVYLCQQQWPLPRDISACFCRYFERQIQRRISRFRKARISASSAESYCSAGKTGHSPCQTNGIDHFSMLLLSHLDPIQSYHRLQKSKPPPSALGVLHLQQALPVTLNLLILEILFQMRPSVLRLHHYHQC